MAHNWTWGKKGSSDPLNLSILASSSFLPSSVRMLPVLGSKNGLFMKTSVKSPLGERVTLCQEGSALEISPALPARNLSSVPRAVKTAPWWPVGGVLISVFSWLPL